VRGPVARSFALGVLVGAVLIAAPLAALTLTPGGPRLAKPLPSTAGKSQPHLTNIVAAPETPADLAHIIASGVSTSVQTAVAAVAPEQVSNQREARSEAAAEALDAARDARENAMDRARDAAQGARDAIREKMLGGGRIDQIIAMKAAGVSPEYVNALRAAQRRLRSVDPGNFAGMQAIGVTPEYARDLAAAGFSDLDSNALIEARSVGLTGDYARAMVAAGIPPNLHDYVELRTIGVPASYVFAIRKSGHAVAPHQIVQMWAVHVKPSDLNIVPPVPPRPPSRKARPAASPPDWDLVDPGDG
jgi:bla regulator protein blaR1